VGALKQPEHDRFSTLLKGEMKMEPRASRISRQVMNAFQVNKFQGIRKANEVRKDYYPEASKGGPKR